MPNKSRKTNKLTLQNLRVEVELLEFDAVEKNKLLEVIAKLTNIKEVSNTALSHGVLLVKSLVEVIKNTINQ